VPSPAELLAFRRHNKSPYRGHITGDFKGTTDEIIQWAAWKWGIDANVLRAVAAEESWWDQRFASNDSYGLTSIKQSVYPEAFPMISSSTAFNLDLYGAIFRKCYDGRTRWLGRHYHAGDLWGCIGAFYSGNWWSPAARSYIAQIKHQLRDRTWRQKRFHT
jgi:hypothetical protein